ncbi:MAG: hypothetical protein ABI134_12240, partial [Byssovorax sp.]
KPMPSPRILATALFLCSLASSGSALAAADPAEVLFDRGVQEMEAGRYDEACPPIEQSYKLDPRLGTLFTLAECEAKRGRIATAVTRYEAYLKEHGKLPRDKKSKQGDRGQTARRQIDLLRPQLPQLTLVLPPAAPDDTRVSCDGAPVERSALGRPVPLDPGAHVITTSAPQRASSEVRLKLARGQQLRLELTLGAAIAAQAAPVVAEAGAGEAPSTSDAVSKDDSRSTSGRRVGAYVAGGVGLAGLILGGVLGGLAIAEKSTVDASCKPTSDPATLGCRGDGFAASQRLQTLGLWSTVGFGVGAAASVTAIVLFATEPAKPKQEARAGGPRRLEPSMIKSASARLSAGPAGATLGIEGAW